MKSFKIVSGGQTGADRAALDFALGTCIPCGGWCPKGRKAEDGMIPERYPLTEMTTEDDPRRTEQNVIDSDRTVIISLAQRATGGTKKTIEFAQKHGRPWLHISMGTPKPGAALAEFIRDNGIKVLNVAGPRESKEPEICPNSTLSLWNYLDLKRLEEDGAVPTVIPCNLDQ